MIKQGFLITENSNTLINKIFQISYLQNALIKLKGYADCLGEKSKNPDDLHPGFIHLK